MPTNLYGPGDNFDLESSHVLPAMIRKFHDAKNRDAASVTLWGSGSPRREFLHVDDLAEACLFLLDNYDGDSAINVGTGSDVSIRELAQVVSGITGFTGDIAWEERMKEHHASLVSAEGKVFFINDFGTLRVVKPGAKYDLLAESELQEKIFASPAMSEGQIFIRGEKSLICLGKRVAKTAAH